LPLFQSVVMNEVNLTAEKRGRGRFELHCRLQIADCQLKKTKTGFLLKFTPDLFLTITHKYQEAGIPLIFS